MLSKQQLIHTELFFWIYYYRHSSVDDKSSALPVPRQPKFPTTTNCTVVEDLENATKNDDTFIINENDSCIQSKVLGHIQTRHLNVVATEENLSVVSPPPVDAHSSTSPTSSPNHGQISSQGEFLFLINFFKCIFMYLDARVIATFLSTVMFYEQFP